MDFGRWVSSAGPPVFFHQHRNGQKRLQLFFHQHRTRAGASAAVRGGKRFVQIQVHHVYAEIAGTRDSRKRVHVGAIHIEQRAARVQDLGHFRDTRLERSQGRRIRDHQRGHIVGDQLLQMLDIDLPARIGADILNFVAGNHRRCRIGAVRGIRNQHNFCARCRGSPGKRESAAGRLARLARPRPAAMSRHPCR